MTARPVRPARPIAAGVAALLSVGLLCVTPAHADPSDAPTTQVADVSSDPTSSEVSSGEASAEAGSSGERVEVTAERSENETVWANPSGSFTREISSVPIRTEQDGEWVPVDYDLRLEGDQVVPVASDADLSFSAGGAGLVDFADNGESLSLDWPGTLPKPTLDGPTATYADVLPGVDLLMTAVAGGYTEVLRVNDAEAAANPALDKLRFAADLSDGASVVQTAAGGFNVRDDEGDIAFSSPAPTMWDSSGHGFNAAGEAAGDGDQIETAGLAANNDRVVVTPDQQMLDDPDTVFPIFIDPTVSGARNEWTMVQKEYPNTEFHNWSTSDGYGEGVGHQDASGVSTKRLIWEFGLGSVPDAATILDATFSADETHSWSCTKAAVNLDRVGLIGAGTNWNNQPAQINTGNLATSNIQVRIDNSTGGDCKKDITRIAFSTDALATAVKNSLDENAIALRLTATESSSVGWKRFQNDATLSITYNREPNPPSPISLSDQSGRGCGSWLPSRTSMPTMVAKVVDPDDDTVDAIFSIDRAVSGSYSPIQDVWVYNLASGSTFQAPVPAAAAMSGSAWVDGLYRFRARGRDVHNVIGDYSGSCAFYLDSKDPVLQPITASFVNRDGVQSVPAEDDWLPTGGNLTFTLDPSGSMGYDGTTLQNDVDYYKVTSDIPALNTTVNPATLGAVGQLPLVTTSDNAGEHWIKAYAVDRAGRISSIITRIVRIAGAVETGRYDFELKTDANGNAIRTAGVTPPGAGPTLGLASGASFVYQHEPELDNGVAGEGFLHLNGVDGYAAASGSAVDDTHAFSLSAWVRPSGPVTSRQVIASQVSPSGVTMSLALQPGCGSACAVFRVGNAVTSATVESTVAVTPGHWNVVAGSWDDLPVNRRIRVWVGDGSTDYAAMTSKDISNTFVPPAATATVVGAEMVLDTNGQVSGYTSYFAGDIEDLRFYTDEVNKVDVQMHIETDNPNYS